jgi:hypothetical protein
MHILIIKQKLKKKKKKKKLPKNQMIVLDDVASPWRFSSVEMLTI